MKKSKITLLAQTILTLDSGTHEAVVDGGNIYVLVQQIDGITVPDSTEKSTPKKAEKAKEVEDDSDVADDTPKKAAPKKAAKKKAAPKKVAKVEEEEVEEEEEDEVEVDGDEIPQDEWADLEKGEVVQAMLVLEEDDSESDPDKLWLAEIVGWKKPKGAKEKELYIKFDEDGESDFLRDGDRLFRHSAL